MDNKVVARFKDGRVLKGTTSNFTPARPTFHLLTIDHQIIEITVNDLKALFFVKDFEGDGEYIEKKFFDMAQVYGRKIVCEFEDGEVLMGYTQGYDADREGFFMIPVDPGGNNERIYVVNSATRRVTTIR